MHTGIIHWKPFWLAQHPALSTEWLGKVTISCEIWRISTGPIAWRFRWGYFVVGTSSSYESQDGSIFVCRWNGNKKFPSDHRSQAPSSRVSTCMGNQPGYTPCSRQHFVHSTHGEAETSGRQSVPVSPPEYATILHYKVWLESGTWKKKIILKIK